MVSVEVLLLGGLVVILEPVEEFCFCVIDGPSDSVEFGAIPRRIEILHCATGEGHSVLFFVRSPSVPPQDVGKGLFENADEILHWGSLIVFHEPIL